MKSKSFRCDCMGNHILCVEIDEEYDFVEFWIAADGGLKPSFFVRIKNALKALKNDEHYSSHSVLLRDDEIERLKNIL